MKLWGWWNKVEPKEKKLIIIEYPQSLELAELYDTFYKEVDTKMHANRIRFWTKAFEICPELNAPYRNWCCNSGRTKFYFTEGD